MVQQVRYAWQNDAQQSKLNQPSEFTVVSNWIVKRTNEMPYAQYDYFNLHELQPTCGIEVVQCLNACAFCVLQRRMLCAETQCCQQPNNDAGFDNWLLSNKTVSVSFDSVYYWKTRQHLL